MTEYLQRRLFNFKNYGTSFSNPAPFTLSKPIVHEGRWLLLGLSTLHNSGAPTTWNLTLSNSVTGESMSPTPTYEYSNAPSSGNRFGYFVFKADFDIDTILMVGDYASNSRTMAGVAFEFAFEPELIKNGYLTGVNPFSTAVKAGDRILALSEDTSRAYGNMTRIVSGDYGIEIFEYVAAADGTASVYTGASNAGDSDRRFYLAFRASGARWSMLENGIEVPVTLEGSSVYVSANTAHALAAGANVYYRGNSTKEVQTISNTRTSVNAMTYMAWARVPAPNNALNVLFSHQAGTTYSANANFFGIDYRSGITSWHMGTTQHSDLIASLSDGKYHHFTYVMNGGTYNAYVDGVLVRTGTLTSTAVDTIRFGTLFAGTSRYPWGEQMADMAVTTTALTGQQVADVYAAGRSRNEGPTAVPLRLSIYESPKHRYWNTSAYEAGIDSATSIVEMVGVTDAMEDAYGVKVSALVNGGTKNGYTSDPVLIDAPETKPAFKAVVNELAKYPVAFIKSAPQVTEIILAANLRSSVGIGGVAFTDGSGATWLNISPSPGTRYDGTEFRDIRFIFHHELAHLLTFSWSEIEAMEPAWVALSGAYIGQAYESLPFGVRPQGFVRDYGKHSFREDFADIVAALMVTSMQPDLNAWLATDEVLAQKVQMVKDFMATKSTVMADPNYYTAIHNP